jgi:hypothetical protein
VRDPDDLLQNSRRNSAGTPRPKVDRNVRFAAQHPDSFALAIFDLEGFGGDKLSYVTWLLSQCLGTKAKAAAADSINAVLTEDAIALLCTRLSTPLQFEIYLKRAFEEGFNVGQKPVTVEVIESILAKDLNDMEPRLTRYGYNAKVLCEVLNVKPREVRALLRGQLPAGRAQELQHEMLAVGIPF